MSIVDSVFGISSEKGALEIEKVTLKAMKETMLELETNMQCRVRNKGQNENRISGNLIYGYFVHKNSRPVDGFPDPHLHIHTVVMNLTYDQVDNKWKAIEMRDKYENRQYYQAIFNSKLALGLQSIGLRTRKTDFNFELEGVFDLTKNDFSRRTAEINAEAIKRNIHDPKEKDKLGVRTRKSKSEKLSQSELKNVYQNLISSDNQKDWLDNLIRTVEPPNKTLQFQELQTQKWFSYTLENTFERHSVTSEQRFLADVLKNGIGQTNLEEVKTLYQRYIDKGIILSEVDPPLNNYKSYKKENEWKNLIPENLQILSKVNSLSSRNNISPSITTKICLLEEQNIVKIIDSKINRFNPLNHQYSKTILKDPYLNLNQKKVVSEIMLSLDGVELLYGKAGTGKTTTLKAVEKGLLEADRQVTILAPTNKAVEVLQLEGFENAMTVQKYLAGGNIFTNKNDHPSHVSTFQDNIHNKPIELTPKQKLKTIPIKDYQTYTNPRNHIIVDEASLVSVRQMERLLGLADKYSQRVLLVGDMKQHKSVERGNILKVIDDYSNIEAHHLDLIIRQQEPFAKAAVDNLSRGNIEQGLKDFKQLGWVEEIQSDKKRLSKVAEIYFDNLPKVQTENIKKDIIPVEKPYYKQANTLLARILKGRLPWDKTKEFELVEKARLEKIEYQKLTSQPSTLIITPTHRDGQEIHQAIRAKLKQENLIDQKDHTIQTLRSLGWTQAQKQETSNYQPGQVLQFKRNKDVFQKGDRWEVIEIESKVKSNLDNQAIQIREKPTKSFQKGDNISLSNLNIEDKKLNTNQPIKELLKIQNTKTKEIQDLPLNQIQAFEVYQKQDLKISKGDLIQTQAVRVILDSQNQPHHTSNGSVYQIKDIDSKTGDLRLQNDWILPKDFANLKSAYYSTSQASQGQTVNHSIFYTSNQSIQNLSQEMVYVTNSRFKLTNTILTPDYQEFKQQSQKGEMNAVALDVRHPEIQIKAKQKVIEQKKALEYQKWYDKQPKAPAKVRTIEREIGISMSM